MPFVHPAEIWKETDRYYLVGPELTRFKDRGSREMVLAMTHEEVVADLLRTDVSSYKQLPQIVYHLQSKWRDEIKALPEFAGKLDAELGATKQALLAAAAQFSAS